MIAKEQLKIGAIVRFKDEGTWDVLSITDDKVQLNGPHPCRSIATVSLEDCLREGELVGEIQRRKSSRP